MTQLHGTYFNAVIHLDKIVKTDEPLKVTITFDEEKAKKKKILNKKLGLSDFSFLKTQALLKDVKTSFSDEVERERERRSEV